ncbi:MAG TPA: coenzyme F420-0:L-glutamate ligase [Egibacteraceae bacterium]|nr:coenzyme F420-0:L-glutamate ligase [Egibacteraceae bacterium]
MLSIIPVAGLPEVGAGDDLAELIAGAADLREGDVVVVSQKIVSKAEGMVERPYAGEPLAMARRRLAMRQAVRVLVDTEQALIIETEHGLVCANAGVDASNVPDGGITLLPVDPDGSARRLREGLRRAAGVTTAVLISDTFGRPWRVGQTDVAIGAAGMSVIRDERGGLDRSGVKLDVTQIAIADEAAAAADLARRKADGMPVVIVRGLDYQPDGAARAHDLVRPTEHDLFPRGRGGVTDALAEMVAPASWAGPVDGGDLLRAMAAAVAAGGGGVGINELRSRRKQTVLAVRSATGQAVDAGAAAGALMAALVDLGYAAVRRAPAAGEQAHAVIEGGRPGKPREVPLQPPADSADSADSAEA